MEHKICDGDARFVLDPLTKVLRCATRKRIVQFEHDCERVTFEVPRLIDGHDMSLCNAVKVHYNNTDRKTKERQEGVYLVDDVRVDPEDERCVTATWLISGNATRYAGTLDFVVRFACADPDGTVRYMLSSEICTLPVERGLDNGEMVEREYSDMAAGIAAAEKERAGAVIVGVHLTPIDGGDESITAAEIAETETGEVSQV